MKPWKSNALLAAGSLAVAWVIAEFVMAVFFPMETVFLEVDPELGWRHAPGRPSFEWRDGELVYHPAQVSMLRRAALNYGPTRSHVLRLIYRNVVKRSRWGHKTARKMGFIYTPDEPASDKEWLGIYRTGEALVERMEEFCRERGVRFFVFMLPLGKNLEMLAHGKRSPALFFEEKLSASLKARGIPHASAVERFSEQWKKGNRLYLLDGYGHWSEEGHAAAAEILFEHLKTWWDAPSEAEEPADSHKESGAGFR
jgi:hypothetical protein